MEQLSKAHTCRERDMLPVWPSDVAYCSKVAWRATQVLAYCTEINGEGVAAWSRHIREGHRIFIQVAAR